MFAHLVGERQIFADEVERHETRKGGHETRKGAWHPLRALSPTHFKRHEKRDESVRKEAEGAACVKNAAGQAAQGERGV